MAIESLRDRRWLWEFVQGYVESYDPAAARAELQPACLDPAVPPMVRARRAIRRLMRSSGLRYGMPLDDSGRWSRGRPPAEGLFLAALARQLDLCGVAALVFGVELEPARRRRELLAFLAALLGLDNAASRISVESDEGRLVREAASLAKPLWKRGQAIVADPVLGLPLHNGLLYCDARYLARLAVDSYRRGGFSAEAASRLRRLVDRQRAALAEALMLMARAENAPSPVAKRVIFRQLRAIGLPSELTKQLKLALESPRSPESIAASLPGRQTRLFILEQVVLGALADGWRSPKERRFLQRLADTLGIPAEELGQIEAELAEFYAEHPDFVDRFQVRGRLADLEDQVLAGVGELIERNKAALLREVREGRELTAALATLARGRKLDADQRRRLRAQLLELAKTVPGLALFAAPGGLLLVIALSKILPPSFLPAMLVPPKPKEADPDVALDAAPPKATAKLG
jgi:uncharacterized tellurite resistance protein B-like protein